MQMRWEYEQFRPKISKICQVFKTDIYFNDKYMFILHDPKFTYVLKNGMYLNI